MTKVVSSIFSESEQIKAFKVFDKIFYVNAYQNARIASLLPSKI